ncbi:hypothetical protein [Aquimarina aquimarini]|uniref:hypothetical protein n=1 Tax=Aquimarina aquimarini TaxID=1191734 RepID=UPI000D556813|nr:hypothetical protein [Aquimarina aquimarini]
MPRNPKVEIKESHTIGWWSKQNTLTVETFEVKIIESKLNLFNSQSLISYHIKGKLCYENNRKPFIKNIHVSERFLDHTNDSIHNKQAIIEITPIVGVKKDKDYEGEQLEFDVTNEKIINSFQWGENPVKFKCLNIINNIIVSQRK